MTGNLIQRYSGLSVSTRSLAVSPDGKFVLSGTTNGELILWDYTTGEELHQLNTRLALSHVVFSPDSRTAYVASLDNKLIYLSIDEKPLPELIQWIDANRYVRTLTCEEKEQYRVNPLCTK
jgi:WD40 repeat protein